MGWVRGDLFLPTLVSTPTTAWDSIMSFPSCNPTVLSPTFRMLVLSAPASAPATPHSGTHTHASPAGFLQYLLYDITSLGFVRQSFEALVEGILVVGGVRGWGGAWRGVEEGVAGMETWVLEGRGTSSN